MSQEMRRENDATELRRNLITAAFDDWEKGDNSDLFKLIDDDVVWRLAGSCPGGGTFHGKNEFLANSARPLHARLARSPVPEVDRIVADGDVVVVEWHGSGESRGGKPYEQSYCWIFQFEDDRIVAITSYLDTLAVARVFDEDA